MQSRLDVGGVVRRVFEIYVDQASVLMPAAAAVFVVTGIISALLSASGSFVGSLIALVLSIVAGTLFTGMIVELVADVQDGRRDASPGQLLRAVAPVIGQLILVGLVAALGIVIGFVLIVIPGLILITVWSVAAPVVVLERPAGLGALGRSRELVRGSGWQVFGVIVILDVVVLILGGVVDGVANSASTGAGIVVSVVVGVLTAPITALAAAVLYFDLRKLAGDSTPVVGPTDPDAAAF